MTSAFAVSHTLAVDAEPGASYPWEGSVPSEGGDVNTGNGNKLTSVHLLDWKVRGGMTLDFTLYHNSQTSYSDELGCGWTWTYDVYINNLTGNPVLHWGDGTSVPYSISGGGGGGGGRGGGTVDVEVGVTAQGTATTYVAPAGIHDTLVKNADNTWTVTRKDGTKYLLNAAGFLTKVLDRNGNAITLTLNAQNYVTKITDPTGRYVNVAVNASGDFTGITDHTGRTWTFSINASDDLAWVRWPDLGDGFTYKDQFGYSAHRITTKTDRRGKVWASTYYSDGSINVETDPLGHATTYAYGASATTIKDPLNHASTHNYASGALASQVDESGYSVSYTARDAARNVTGLTDLRGRPWAFAYDTKGNVTTATDPLGHTKTFTYNAYSEPLTFTNSLGHTITKTYDGSGNLLTITNPLNKVVQTNVVGAYGLVSSTTDALGKTTTFGYSADGDLASHTDPTSATLSIVYDALGRPTSLTDAAGNIKLTDYDAWGRETLRTHPATTGSVGATESTSYYATGEVQTVRDELGHATNFVYDDAGRLTSVTNPRGDVESYAYDNADRCTAVTTGRGKTRTYTYTDRGDVSSLTMPDGAVEAWSRDGAGDVTAYVNPLSQTILYTFDGAGRRTLIDYPTGTDTTFGYDNADRRISMVDSTGTTTWTYDAADRQTGFSSPQGAQTSGYDDAGQRVSLVGTGISRTWTYDPTGRILSVSNEGSESSTYLYDSAGRLSRLALHNGQVSLYGYDARERLTSIVHKASPSGPVISAESYVYDAANNLSSKTVDGVTTTYGYDLADQLTSESRSGYNASYSYDANGNRTSRTLNGVTQFYTVDDGDKLSAITQGGTTVKAYTYDAGGRTKTVVSSAGTTTLSYDYESRLTGISYPGGGTNAFTYNGLDTRVGKIDSTGAAVYRRDGAGPTSDVLSDGAAVYTPGVSQRRAGATTYNLSDHLGTASRQTNAAGATTATRSYDAFGTRLSSTGAPTGPFGFAGEHGYQEDGDSGLQLLGRRYYDPSTGRFITRDPLQDGGNWYAYCDNNPLSATDPEGLQTGYSNPFRDARREMIEQAAKEQILEWLKTQADAEAARRHLENTRTRWSRVREAKREAGIPMGQNPDAQGTNGKGERWYEFHRYDTHGKRETILIVVHDDGSVHYGRPKPGSTHRQDKNGKPKYWHIEGTTGHIGQPYKDRIPGRRWIPKFKLPRR